MPPLGQPYICQPRKGIIGVTEHGAQAEMIPGFRNNSHLRIIVVSPSAEKSLQSRQLLRGSPKVKTISLGAKEALNDGHVRRAIDTLLEESAEDEVF